MDKKIAIGLIIGALFAVAAGLLTAEKKYYLVLGFENHKAEISKVEYLKEEPRYTKEEKTYNPIFMALGFLGGLGAGYLIGGCFSLVKKKKKETKPLL